MWCLVAAILSSSPMIPSQRQKWRRVIIMSLLLIVTCGIFLCQPTVNEKQDNLSILCSGRTGRCCWWLLVRRFWQKQELSARRQDNRAQQTGWCAYKDLFCSYQALQKLFYHFAGKWWCCLEPVLKGSGIFPKCLRVQVNLYNFCKTTFLNFRLKVEDNNDERSFKACKQNLYTKVKFNSLKWLINNDREITIII